MRSIRTLKAFKIISRNQNPAFLNYLAVSICLCRWHPLSTLLKTETLETYSSLLSLLPLKTLKMHQQPPHNLFTNLISRILHRHRYQRIPLKMIASQLKIQDHEDWGSAASRETKSAIGIQSVVLLLLPRPSRAPYWMEKDANHIKIRE